MKNFDTRTYNVSDFIEWDDTGLLELSADFQRRYVWSEKAKSYLIDTIVRGKPIPKILIQQQLKGKRNLRVVVDGQQRLRTLLSFYRGEFKISRVHNKEYANKTFDDLPPDLQDDFLKYELGVDLLFDMPYEDILDVFARLNSYTAKLTKQEIFNAKYVGYFKQIAFKYGIKYVHYLIDSKVVTKAKVARMGEVELFSDLLVSLLDGVQTNKVVESYYKKYEETEGNIYSIAERFDVIMSDLVSIYSAKDLSHTNFKRIHLFYTLFTTLGHAKYGLGELDANCRFKISKNHNRIRIILDEFSGTYDQYLDDTLTNEIEGFDTFMYYSQRGTTDSTARIYRSNYLSKYIKDRL